MNIEGEKTDTTDLYSDPGDNTYFKSLMGVTGLSNTYFFNKNTYGKIIFAVSGIRTIITNDSLPKDAQGNYSDPPIPDYRNSFDQVKYSFVYVLNKKFSAKNNLNSGIICDLYNFSLVDSMLYNGNFILLRNFRGSSSLIQLYSTWQHRFTDKLSLNTGIHFQLFTFNSTKAIEPRMGLKYQFTKNQSLAIGYGLHSQLQAFQAYFREDQLADGSYVRTNKNLDFTRSHQVILSYDRSFGKDKRVKAEAYYQYLFNAPVERDPSSFSMLNSGADFVIFTSDSMVNEGKGRNYGMEVTLEKFYSKGYYFLFTASLYNSLYTGSDGIERNTAFNGNYTFNGLGGKEFKIKEKNAITIDIKTTWAGGRRYTPIDLEKSIAAGGEVRIDSLAYTLKLKDYIRVDLKIGYRLNGKKISHEWALDVQNIFNRKNDFIIKYSNAQKKIIRVPQLGIFPVLQYRVTF